MFPANVDFCRIQNNKDTSNYLDINTAFKKADIM